MTPSPDTRPVRLWDLPTRLFHWLFAAVVAGAWITGEWASALDPGMGIHMFLAECALALVLFRLIWGFVGGRHARFGDFVRGPGAALDYLRHHRTGEPWPHLGHNPLGGWMVVVLLLAVSIQAGTGLFATDDVLIDGPLAHLVDSGTRGDITSFHRLWASVLLALVGLHVLAVFAYLIVKKDNLVRPMVRGIKDVPAAIARDDPAAYGSVAVAAGILALSALAVWALVTLV